MSFAAHEVHSQIGVVLTSVAAAIKNWSQRQSVGLDIETCQDWAVPYIGGLIGYQPVQSVSAAEACADCGGGRNDADIARTVSSMGVSESGRWQKTRSR